MAYQARGWIQRRTTIIGSEVALLGGVMATIFGFGLAISSQSMLNLLLGIGAAVSILLFAVGLILMRISAGRRASIGFASLAITAIALMVAQSAVDALAASSRIWAALDILLVFGGSSAALIGGILLVASLGSLTEGARVGRASGNIFLIGGIIQMLAGVIDSAGIASSSTYLESTIGTPIFGIAAILWAVVAPALLYLAVRRLRKTLSSERNTRAAEQQIRKTS